MLWPSEPARRLLRALALVLSPALLAACGGIPDSVVVLLPDEDGTVGAVEVSNAGATTSLNQANQAAGLRGPKVKPGESFAMPQADVEQIFGPAIAAEPQAPERFILYFVTGTTELTEFSLNQLPKVLEALAGRAAPDVDVVGHTDRAGSDAYNRKLAAARAAAVGDAIVKIGVDPAQIRVTSHGEHNPLIPTADGVAEPRNRRVEVVVR